MLANLLSQWDLDSYADLSCPSAPLSLFLGPWDDT
jgi:hypothetical protein